MYSRTEGVILSRRNLGEADRILTIYTRDFGKITVLAKGVRRPKSRKSGHVELGNLCKLFFAKGKTLDLLTEVEVKKAFGIVNFSPERANKIYHLLEVVESLTAERQKNIDVFMLLTKFLKRITSGEDFNLISAIFKLKLLETLGFFSVKNLKESKSKSIITQMEEEKFEKIKKNVEFQAKDYLKLLIFLDSMIESLIQSKLKTSRFLNGNFSA